MMSKALIPFVIAIVLAAGAFWFGRNLLQGRKPAGPGREYINVVVAKKALEPGYALKLEDMTVTELPRESAPQTAVLDARSIVDRVIAVPLAKGQILVDSSLAPEDGGVGMQALVPPGMRAVTLEVNEYSGMTGVLQPGVRVDVLVTLIDEETRRTISRTIVENVKVLRVGRGAAATQQDGSATDKLPTSVTLLVSVKQAESIDLATNKGRPRLVLRGGQDKAPVLTAGVSIGELLGGSTQRIHEGSTLLAAMVSRMMNNPATQPTTRPAELVTAPQRPLVTRRAVQIIKGGKESVKQFKLVADTDEVILMSDVEPQVSQSR